jgi:hypothetical protein
MEVSVTINVDVNKQGVEFAGVNIVPDIQITSNDGTVSDADVVEAIMARINVETIRTQVANTLAAARA